MHAHSNYTIKFKGEPDDIKKALSIIKEKLDIDVSGTTDTVEIIEEYTLVWVENITEDLALTIAKTSPELTFTVKGVVDASESAGEYMDFSISYIDGKLTEETSCWYIIIEMYPDIKYEDFCDDYCDQEGNPLCSEEEYEELKDNEEVFVLESGNGKIVTKVTLSDIREIEI